MSTIQDTYNVMRLHSRGRAIVQCEMFNEKTPQGYDHQKEQGYHAGEGENEVRVRVAKFGIIKFSTVDHNGWHYQVGCLAGKPGHRSGWRISSAEYAKLNEQEPV